MKLKSLIYSIVISVSVILTGCAKDSLSPGSYDSAEVGKVKKVVGGTIISLRPVVIHNKAAESTAVNVNAPNTPVDNSEARNHGFEYVIRLNSGAIISLVQTDLIKLKVKQKVLVIYGDNTRVVPDDGGDDN